MVRRRSKLNRHGTKLLVPRRAEASIAQMTRWLGIRRDTGVAATTVGRWPEYAPTGHAAPCRRFPGT